MDFKLNPERDRILHPAEAERELRRRGYGSGYRRWVEGDHLIYPAVSTARSSRGMGTVLSAAPPPNVASGAAAGFLITVLKLLLTALQGAGAYPTFTLL